MKCSVDGCYAVPYVRRMCSNHYRLWREAALTETAGSGFKKGAFRGAPTPTTTISACRCSTPTPGVLALLSKVTYLDVEPKPGMMVECRSCRRPIAEFLSPTKG